MTIELKNYTNASNARRAAKAAGLSEFDVYKGTDGWYKIRLAAAKGAKPLTNAKLHALADSANKPRKAAKAAKPSKDAKPRQMVDESARDSRKLAKLTAGPPGKRAAVLAAAQAGKLPPPLDFSAPTHARYRDAAEELVALAKAGNIEVLKRLTFKTYSSSPKAMAKYRDLAVIALEARAAAEQAA